MVQSLFDACCSRCAQRDVITIVEKTIDNLPDHVTQKILLQCIKASKINSFARLIAVWPKDNISFRNASGFDQGFALVLVNQILEKKTGKAIKFNLEYCHFGESGTKALLSAVVNKSMGSMTRPSSHKEWSSCDLSNDIIASSLSQPIVIWCDIIFNSLTQSSTDLYAITMKALTNDEGDIRIIATGLEAIIAPLLLFPLLDTIKIEYFKRLIIPRSNVTGKYLMALCSYLENLTNLEVLDLSYNNVSKTSVDTIYNLSKALKNLKKLTELRLTGNYLCDSLNAVIESICPGIRCLYLAGCGVKKKQLKLMVSSNSIDRLIYLDLGSNNLSVHLKPLLNLLAKLRPSIERLALDCNHFTKKQVENIISEVTKHESIKRLDLRGNESPFDGVSVSPTLAFDVIV